MVPPNRRSILQCLGAGLATLGAGCSDSTTIGAEEESPASGTPSPTASPISGGRVGTTTSDARPDLVVYNQSDTQQPIELVVRNRDGEKTFEKELTLNPKGEDGDRWFRSNTFSRDSGVLWENEKDLWTIEVSTDAVTREHEFIYDDGNRVHVHIFAEDIGFAGVE